MTCYKGEFQSIANIKRTHMRNVRNERSVYAVIILHCILSILFLKIQYLLQKPQNFLHWSWAQSENLGFVQVSLKYRLQLGFLSTHGPGVVIVVIPVKVQ